MERGFEPGEDEFGAFFYREDASGVVANFFAEAVGFTDVEVKLLGDAFLGVALQVKV